MTTNNNNKKGADTTVLLNALRSLCPPTPASPVNDYYPVSPSHQAWVYNPHTADVERGEADDGEDVRVDETKRELKRLLGEWQCAYKKLEAERNHWYIEVCKMRKKI